MTKLLKNYYCRRLVSFAVIAIAMLTVISTNYVYAQPVVDNTSGAYTNGDYQLNDFISLAVKIAQIIWAISGSLSLLMFVYGGVLFLISSGHSQTVDRAKQTITGAVIGLAIVFGSYAIVYFIMVNVLKTGSNPFTSGWFK